MITRRGIYPDIRNSTYPFTVGEITFYFSSMFYRQKFMNEYREEVARFNLAANNVYKNKFCIDMTPLSVIRLYCLIEKRGFYLVINGEEVHCPNDLRHVLVVEKKPNFKN